MQVLSLTQSLDTKCKERRLNKLGLSSATLKLGWGWVEVGLELGLNLPGRVAGWVVAAMWCMCGGCVVYVVAAMWWESQII